MGLTNGQTHGFFVMAQRRSTDIYKGILIGLRDDEVRTMLGLCINFGNILADDAQTKQLQMVDAQPATGSPKIRRRTTTKIRQRKEIRVIQMPNQETMLNGVCEKFMMPSIA